jgi:3-deoxy-D-manno-octulosonic-acid transferase
MIYALYNILLLPALFFIIPYHLYRSLSRGRKAALAERFGFIPADKVAAVAGVGAIWVHAVSVGETIAAVPLLKALKKRYPERRIVLSNGTETGRGVAEKLAEVDCAIYFPFDYRFAAARVLRVLQPALVVIVETEIWPNFLRMARGMGIPVVLANGRISDRSFGRYLKLRWFFRRVLENFAALCMQSDVDAARIIAVGAAADRVHVVRNLKYDIPAAPVAPSEQAALRNIYRLPPDVPVVTAGSTHDGEEEEVVAAYRTLLIEGRSLFLVLVPRHPERAGAVAEILRREGMAFTLRSQLDGRSAPLAPGEVLLVDTIGELMKLYALSAVVFVGGSLVPTGGHNVLEPASLGVPVLFGPHMGNFREIAALILGCGGGVQIGNGAELADTLRILLDDSARRTGMGRNGARLLEENSGSAERHLAVLARFTGGN